MNSIAGKIARRFGADASNEAVQPVAATAQAAVVVSDAMPKFSRVLSIEKGDYYVESIESRQHFCLVADHTGTQAELLVSASHVADSMYQSYKHRITLFKKVHFVERRVTIDELVRIYRDATVASVGDTNEKEQRQMLGYIKEAAALGASDLRIIIQGDNAAIRYKVHGRGRTLHRLTRTEGFTLARALYNGMCSGGGTQLDELKEQDAQLRQEFAHQAGLVGTRIATRPAKQAGLLLTLRLIPEASLETNTLESAGYLPQQIEILEYQVDRPSGSVWFSGVTGSGKSTSLAVLLQMLQKRESDELDIITIEDPIETDMKSDGLFQTPHTYDRSSPTDSSEAWPRGIKSLMRHAPNGIMPGEVRDKAAADAALDFTMTGHMVYTTIHVDRFFNIPLRLIEMGVTRSLALNPGLMTGLINQTLVRILCPSCKRPLREHRADMKSTVLRRLDKLAEIDSTVDLDTICIAAARGSDCNVCGGRGTKRRKVASEICMPDAKFMSFLRNEDPIGGLRYWVTECGGMTKLQHAIGYMRVGDVDPSHLERDVLPLDEDIRTLGLTP
jgi:general secretion pathway protein E